jgi:hypothetical protein
VRCGTSPRRLAPLSATSRISACSRAQLPPRPSSSLLTCGEVSQNPGTSADPLLGASRFLVADVLDRGPAAVLPPASPTSAASRPSPPRSPTGLWLSPVGRLDSQEQQLQWYTDLGLRLHSGATADDSVTVSPTLASPSYPRLQAIGQMGSWMWTGAVRYMRGSASSTDQREAGVCLDPMKGKEKV